MRDHEQRRTGKCALERNASRLKRGSPYDRELPDHEAERNVTSVALSKFLPSLVISLRSCDSRRFYSVPSPWLTYRLKRGVDRIILPCGPVVVAVG